MFIPDKLMELVIKQPKREFAVSLDIDIVSNSKIEAEE